MSDMIICWGRVFFLNDRISQSQLNLTFQGEVWIRNVIQLIQVHNNIFYFSGTREMYCHACAHYVLHTDKNCQKCFSKICLSAIHTILIIGLSNFIIPIALFWQQNVWCTFLWFISTYMFQLKYAAFRKIQSQRKRGGILTKIQIITQYVT
jgi:hypothetical protein